MDDEEHMPDGGSPAVACRRVRLAMREAREAVDLTPGRLTEQVEWSPNKFIRIENGDVHISMNDLPSQLGLIDSPDVGIMPHRVTGFGDEIIELGSPIALPREIRPVAGRRNA
ncbi:hypothetical protein ACWKSP_19565 [Micromonosporaceae bacterium Da 78-11]